MHYNADHPNCNKFLTAPIRWHPVMFTYWLLQRRKLRSTDVAWRCALPFCNFVPHTEDLDPSKPHVVMYLLDPTPFSGGSIRPAELSIIAGSCLSYHYRPEYNHLKYFGVGCPQIPRIRLIR